MVWTSSKLSSGPQHVLPHPSPPPASSSSPSLISVEKTSHSMSAIKNLFGGTITATLPTELIDASYVFLSLSILPMGRLFLHSET